MEPNEVAEARGRTVRAGAAASSRRVERVFKVKNGYLPTLDRFRLPPEMVVWSGIFESFLTFL